MATCIYMLEVETDATIRAYCEEELATAYHDLQLCLSIVYRFAHGKILGKYVLECRSLFMLLKHVNQKLI